MARPTLSSHPKFAKLAARLRSRAIARGTLELLWESCYAAGDPALGDAESLEAIADWQGVPGALAEALADCGFIDVEQLHANGEQLHANGEQLHANGEQLHEVTRRVFFIHDLEHHAPAYVVQRWQRESERRERGETIRSVRQAAARSRWSNALSNRNANGHRLHTNVAPPITDPDPRSSSVGILNSQEARADQTRPRAEWRPYDWLKRYGAAWAKQYGQVAYGQPSDSKACAALADILDALPDAEKLAAQAKADGMIAEFLASTDKRVVSRRHPFSFFVQEWGGLRVPKQAAARQSESEEIRPLPPRVALGTT